MVLPLFRLSFVRLLHKYVMWEIKKIDSFENFCPAVFGTNSWPLRRRKTFDELWVSRWPVFTLFWRTKVRFEKENAQNIKLQINTQTKDIKKNYKAYLYIHTFFNKKDECIPKVGKR